MSTQPGTNTPKKARCRKVAAPNPLPLTHNERSALFDLIDMAHKTNHQLLDAGRELEIARDAMEEAQKNLELAEGRMRAVRAENSAIHADLAPLLHRLPVC